MSHSLFRTDDWYIDSARLKAAQTALEKAKNTELNKRRTVPKRINSNLVVYITPEQDNDPAFMKNFQKRWEKR